MLSFHIKKTLAHFTLDMGFDTENEIVVLFGPSGSGKTTVLNCIAGLQHPDEGFIRLNEVPFFDEKSKPMPPQKRKVGYLFQEYALFPHMTVEKNIAYGMDAKKRGESGFLVSSLLSVLGIEHLLSKYPHQISGGEKQRVALARALATEPSILLLDEPLSALDQETRLQCQEELLRIHEMWRIPFIIVTHDKGEAEKLGDKILFIEKGRIMEKAIPQARA
ncbi:ATP-binding cassette domain-containing protein [Ammoniphilus sp. CFH 90114]|uniref:ATP-binding cassette domain-containing protein n=1 Tax=Ammoniphilus sp. CFH 90114 TaxID=2493665 RepID=UPI00100EAA24|nr:ATP-binding cassette domain-containing protein [Ammoniphilus sp. CFH 90114]RXT05253.1 ATP-binding cassette domain-containing protein [Ammoniphilus sp. CFH 90114]